ncbi:MAG: hypothetical protein AABZ80_01245, partial [Gemmatimonadota bacterium]
MHRTLLIAALLAPAIVGGQDAPKPVILESVPRANALVSKTASELALAVDRYASDQTALNRRYDANESPAQRQRMREFYNAWRTRLTEVDFDKLSHEGRVDYVLIDNYLIHQNALLDRDHKLRAEAAPLLPFQDRLLSLQDSRRDLKSIDQAALARVLADAARQVDSLRALFEPAPVARGADSGRARATPPKVTRTVANRAADDLDAVRRIMQGWYRFYDGYDPLFSWWTRDPFRKLDSAMVRYGRTLRERVVGLRPQDIAQNTGPIIGDPIGADGLKEDLRFEM